MTPLREAVRAIAQYRPTRSAHGVVNFGMSLFGGPSVDHQVDAATTSGTPIDPSGFAPDRRSRVPLAAQLRALIPLVAVWGAVFLGLAIIAVQDRVPVQELFLDPAALDGGHWYSGIVSQFGILGWTVAVCAAAGGAMLADMARRPQARSFLASGALVTGLLLADDLLQLHSYHAPKYLGISKEVAYGAYLVLLAGWVWWHRAEVFRTRALVLAAAGLAFLVSIAFDQVQLPLSENRSLWFEDSAKFFGIVAFATYFVLTVRDIGWSILRNHPATSHRP